MRAAPKFSSERLARLADRLETDVSAGAIAGVSLMIGSRDACLWRRSIGFRDIVGGDLLQDDAIWRIFSMTKVVVSIAALVLAERGLLRLDQPVADLIPAFATLRVMQTDGSSIPARTVPTVQDLLRHTAGLSYGYLGDSAAQRAYVADGFLGEDLDNEAFADRIAALPLEHEPGTTWHYSHATDVLGRVLEVAGGSDLQNVLATTLFQPLDMADTCFRLPAAAASRVAEPLPQKPDQRPIFFDPCVPRRGQRGNGGLVSTLDDYGKFLRMLLADGRGGDAQILSPSMVRLMRSDHLGAGIAKAPYYPPGQGYGFGLGVAVRIAAGEAPIPGTIGDWFWSGVGGTYFWVDPENGFHAMLMMQTSSAEQRQHYRTLARTMIYAALDPIGQSRG